MPLILRYLLEVCEETREAVEVLRRIPSTCPTTTLIDRAGDYATVFLAPGPAGRDHPPALATNHQGRVEWPEQARFSRTVERAAAIERRWRSPA